MKSLIISIIMLQLLGFEAYSAESVFVRITEVRKGCTGIEPHIVVIPSNGAPETIPLEKTKKFMSPEVLMIIKKALDQFINLGYQIASSSSSFTGSPQECSYLTDYILTKE